MPLILHHWVLCVVLILLTALSWSYRFEISPHPINQTTLAQVIRDDPKNAKVRGLEAILTTDGNLIQIGQETRSSRNSSVGIVIDNSLELRAIHLRFDYRWTEVVPGKPSWREARGVFSDKTEKGWRHPADFGLFHGNGTQDWSALDIIRELPEAGRKTQVSFQMLGERGLLEIKNFRIHKVSERTWFPFAMGTLVIAWFIWITNSLRRLKTTDFTRKIIAATTLFVISWITIFPQTSTLFFPAWGQFNLGEISELEAKITTKSNPKKTSPLTQKPPPQAEPLKKPTPPKSQPSAVVKEAPKVPTTKEVAENKLVKAKGDFHNAFKGAVHGNRWLHLPAYLLFAILILTITGQARSVVMVIGVGVLSEIVPPLMRYGFDRNDLLDLIFNLIGIGIGFLIWSKITCLLKKWTLRIGSQA